MAVFNPTTANISISGNRVGTPSMWRNHIPWDVSSTMVVRVEGFEAIPYDPRSMDGHYTDVTSEPRYEKKSDRPVSPPDEVYKSINKFLDTRVMVGNVNNLRYEEVMYRDDLGAPRRIDGHEMDHRDPYAHRDSTSGVRHRIEMNMQFIHRSGPLLRIDQRDDVVVLSKRDLDNLTGDIHVAVADVSVKTAMPQLAQCVAKLNTLQRALSERISVKLNDETEDDVSDLIDQCNLEIQEIIDGLE